MNETLQTKILSTLERIETTQDTIEASIDRTEEGQVRSVNNERLARQLGTLGVCLEELEDLARRAKDEHDQIRASVQINLVNAGASVAKAEIASKNAAEARSALAQLRSLEKQAGILSRKYRSMYSFLENSRSRLSWLGKERVNA